MPTKTSDARADAQSLRERQIAAAAHARSKKQQVSAQITTPHNGSSLRELALVNTEPATFSTTSQGMSWNAAPLELLNTYRVAHNIPSSAAFTTPLRQALLTNPGIGRNSPTMARKKEKRRVSKEQLALAVRKHFNGAAVSEIDVVVELVYRIHNMDKAFRMRSTPGVTKKQ